MNEIQIAKEIKEFSNYQIRFKKIIKDRINGKNGHEFIKVLSKNYDYEKALKKITSKMELLEISNILKKYKIIYQEKWDVTTIMKKYLKIKGFN